MGCEWTNGGSSEQLSVDGRNADAAGQNSGLQPTLRDAGTHAEPTQASTYEAEDIPGLEPTQRLSQVRSPVV